MFPPVGSFFGVYICQALFLKDSQIELCTSSRDLCFVVSRLTSHKSDPRPTRLSRVD